MSPLKKILNLFHPILKPLSTWYLSRTRTYSYEELQLKIFPGVFHPGLFFSTGILLGYLKTQPLDNKRLLELGAGSGLISLFCSKKGARVTASDVNKIALNGILENAQFNNINLKIVESDLFNSLNPSDFDMIIINPPYYPKNISANKDLAWFCGENFEYFERLFHQLSGNKVHGDALMILSEDCDMERIKSIAKKNSLLLTVVHSAKKRGELNYIFKITDA